MHHARKDEKPQRSFIVNSGSERDIPARGLSASPDLLFSPIVDLSLFRFLLRFSQEFLLSFTQTSTLLLRFA
jgi:hypothetical protein